MAKREIEETSHCNWGIWMFFVFLTIIIVMWAGSVDCVYCRLLYRLICRRMVQTRTSFLALQFYHVYKLCSDNFMYALVMHLVPCFYTVVYILFRPTLNRPFFWTSLVLIWSWPWHPGVWKGNLLWDSKLDNP